MRARRQVFWLLAAFCLASRAHAANPLMCQIGGSLDGNIPPVQADFHALVNGGVSPLMFHWDFGDGGSSTDPNPSHTFGIQGIYPVVMTVTDSDVPPQACRDTVKVPIGIAIDFNCIAQASTRWGAAPLGVQFTAHEGFVFDPPPYTWSWTFGDGESGVEQNPLHTYQDTGTYYAVATLHTPNGSYPCSPTIRLSDFPADVTAIGPGPRPIDLVLSPPTPNPFTILASIGYQLPEPGRVRLEILDVTGRVVAKLVDEHRRAGSHLAIWHGHRQAPGLYLARLEQSGRVRSARFVRLP